MGGLLSQVVVLFLQKPELLLQGFQLWAAVRCLSLRVWLGGTIGVVVLLVLIPLSFSFLLFALFLVFLVFLIIIVIRV